jgi:hypothetical protein
MDVHYIDSSTCKMKYSEMIEAADHLYKALHSLMDVNDQVMEGLIDFVEIVGALSGAWNEINTCRIYTQESVDFEELLIPAMGLVNDAKSMIESLVAWKLGLTPYGRISILSSVRTAIADGVGPAIALLENCMTVA